MKRWRLTTLEMHLLVGIAFLAIVLGVMAANGEVSAAIDKLYWFCQYRDW